MPRYSLRTRLHNSELIIHNSSFTLYLLTFALVFACASLMGCGVQGPPRPPRIEMPEKILDLAVIQKGSVFELSFTRPVLATDGERLTKPLEFEIFRTITGPGGASKELKMGPVPWKTLYFDELQNFSGGEKIVFPLTLSVQEYSQSLGSTFTFAVRGFTRGFHGRRIEGDDSNIVRTVLLDVCAPVDGLEIKTTEKALILNWTPPSHSLLGRTLAGPLTYRVYRSLAGKPGTFQMLGDAAAPVYSDSDFAFGHNYFYKVRAVLTQTGQTAESEDSSVAAITPRDTFPPGPPTNVSALFSAGAVQLVWTANTEPDLAGYNVYRREKGGVRQKLNLELLRTPTFEDRTVQAGRQYFYIVTSIDLAHNESSPSEEATVETP